MNKFIYISLCSLVFLFTSCEKWLTIQPNNEIEKTKLYETEDGFWQATNGIYYYLYHIYDPSVSATEYRYSVDVWEDLICLWTVSSTSSSAQWNKHMYKNSNVENDMEIIFLNLYNLIAHCNTILQYVDNVDFLPSTSYNIIKGEALALRAYFHFDLMRLWGPMPTNIDENYTYLPYVTQVSKSSSEYNTYEDYMSFLLEDLDEAERLLKMSDPIVNYSCDELNTGSMFGDYNRTEFYYRQNRMNYYGACALHARVALWMNDQQTAVSYADSIINATNADGSLKFTLGTASDVSEETQTNTNTLHTEHLFSIYYSYYNWQESWSTIQDNKHYFQWSKISSLFNGDENDFRFGTLCYQPDDSQQAYGTSRKYMCYDDLWVPLARLSEMYFIVMECGSLDRANELYNQFCASRGCQYTELTAENRQSIVLQEYYKEFIAEGQIFFANKRLAIQNPLWVEDDMREEQYVLPIPERESNLQ